MKRIILCASFMALTFFTVFGQEVQQSPGLDVLGFGYDVFGKYADMTSKKRYRLFDYNKTYVEPIGTAKYEIPEYVILENISDHVVKIVEGSSKRDYSSNLSIQAGLSTDSLFFSGSIESSYDWNSSGSVQKYFYTYMDANIKWRINFDERHMDQLKSIMEPQARKDINSMDPTKLFKLYGTHYITSAYLGGRADFTTETEMTSSTTQEQVALAVQASFRSVSGHASLSSSEQEAKESVNMNSQLRVIGGNSEYANNISEYEQYEKWASGIKDFPVLCDFDENSLSPIWNLADSPSRQQELKSAFDELCRQKPLPPAMANIVAMEQNIYMIKSLANFSSDRDMYWDINGYHSYAEQKGASVNLNQSDIYTEEAEGADRFIKMIPHHVDPDWVFLQPQHSNYVAEVSGAGLQLKDQSKNRYEQLYKLIPVDGKFSTFYIKSRSSGKYLEAQSGQKVTSANFTGKNEQMWFFESHPASDVAPPAGDKFYTVKSEAGGLEWDFPGAYPSSYAYSLELWEHEGLKADRVVWLRDIQESSGFQWKGIEPQHFNGRSLTIVNDSYNMDPTEHFDRQLFRFEYGGSPNTWYIINQNNTVIEADRNEVNKKGCSVRPAQYTGESHQRWILTAQENVNRGISFDEFNIRLAGTNLYWDLGGSDYENNYNGASVIMWDLDAGGDRRFRFIPHNEGFYHIEVQNGGRVLNIEGGQKRNNGANMIIWDYEGKDYNWFNISPSSDTTCIIKNNHSGKVLDVNAGDDGFTNGDNLHQWDYNGSAHQQWELIYASGPKKGQVYKW